MREQKDKRGRERKEFLVIALAILLFSISFFIITIDDPTGRVISDVQETKKQQIKENFTEDTILDFELENITRIATTGKLIGESNAKARIYAETSGGSKLLIAEIDLDETSPQVSPFTARVTDGSQQNEEDEVVDDDVDEDVEDDVDDDVDDETDDEVVVDDVDEDVEDDVNVEDVDEVDDADDEVDDDVDDEVVDDESDEVVDDESDDEADEVVDDVDDEVDDDEDVDDADDDETDEVDDEVVDDEEEELLIKEFENTCSQTCDLIKNDFKNIIIEVENGVLYLDEITYVQELQQLGEGIKQDVESFTLMIGENKTLDATTYFEGEDLIFDAKTSEGYNYEVRQNKIIFTAEKQGTWESLLYAIENNSLIISNTFNITITEKETTPIENETDIDDDVEDVDDEADEVVDDGVVDDVEDLDPELPINETEENITIEDPIENETTEQIINETMDCDHPDPNQRPLECIQHENATYFQEENLVVENKQAKTVGKFTPIGNLLITGDYVEHTTEEPNENDYQLGYSEDGEFKPTIWINTETGDLHLKGELIEANTNIVHELGKYAISNKRGILLAVVDRHTGDMTIRGSVIPYRRSLE